MPIPELVERIQRASRALADIEAMIEQFIETHGPAIREYQTHNRDERYPNDVSQAIDAVTGYTDFHSRMMNVGDSLEKLY